MRALLDLVCPAACAGCERPGRPLCAECARELERPARLSCPTPSPPGLPAVYAVADYDARMRGVIVAYKERGAAVLRPALAGALARSVAAAVAACGGGPVVLVPMPSRRSAVRSRGADVVRELAVAAARHCRQPGTTGLTVAAVLRHTRCVADSAGLDAEARRHNLNAALAVRRPLPTQRVVLVDDLVTTGATLAEAARALRAAGSDVVAAATVAATRRNRSVRGLPNGVGGHYRAAQGYPDEEVAWTSWSRGGIPR